MRNIEAEYKRLIRQELIDLLDLQMKRIKGESHQTVLDSLEATTNKIYDITNADFEENFNSNHAEEQNAKPF